jgi:hypothetical protein
MLSKSIKEISVGTVLKTTSRTPSQNIWKQELRTVTPPKNVGTSYWNGPPQ